MQRTDSDELPQDTGELIAHLAALQKKEQQQKEQKEQQEREEQKAGGDGAG